MAKIHYDKDLSGVTACGRTNHDHAHEDITEVTCKDCLQAYLEDLSEQLSTKYNELKQALGKA